MYRRYTTKTQMNANRGLEIVCSKTSTRGLVGVTISPWNSRASLLSRAVDTCEHNMMVGLVRDGLRTVFARSLKKRTAKFNSTYIQVYYVNNIYNRTNNNNIQIFNALQIFYQIKMAANNFGCQVFKLFIFS